MNLQGPNYGTAYLILGILSFTSWALFVLGFLGLFVAFVDNSGPAFIFYGVVVSFLGLAGVATVQISRAVIDNATYSWLILQELRSASGLAPEKESPSVGSKDRQIVGTINKIIEPQIQRPNFRPNDETVPSETKIYARGGKEVSITHHADGRFSAMSHVGIKFFDSIEEAKNYFE